MTQERQPKRLLLLCQTFFFKTNYYYYYLFKQFNTSSRNSVFDVGFLVNVLFNVIESTKTHYLKSECVDGDLLSCSKFNSQESHITNNPFKNKSN